MAARRSGFNVSLRRSNSAGVGKMTPAGEKAKKQVNVRKCPKCGAKPGQTCFVLTADKFIELNETHTTRTAKQSQAKKTSSAHQTRQQPQQQSVQRRSTSVLDARYKARKDREGANQKKLNGG